MSTNSQRIRSAIQRIVKSDPQIRSLLDAYESRGDLPGAGARAGSTPEENKDNLCCDGTTDGGGGTGSDDGGSTGTETTFPGDGQDGLDPNDPGNLDGMEGGSLDGLVDCETNESVCFEGGDWIPPDGWDSPTDPPQDPTWEQGIYWEVESHGGVFYSAGKPNICGYVGCGETCTQATNLISCLGGSDYEGEYAFRTEKYCSSEGDNPEGVCVDEPPLVDNWPSDGCVNLAVKNGQIVGSKNDPENNGSYSKGKSEISLCDPDTGDQVDIKPTQTGGWKSINPAVNGGDGYMYNSSGKRIARISGSEYSDPNI